MRDFLEILVADEAVEEGMTDREIHAALERRRLRGLPERGDDILMRPPLSDFWVKDGDMFVMVGERYNFDIRQWDLFTKSKLVTTLSLQFKREDAFNVVPEYRKGMLSSKNDPHRSGLSRVSWDKITGKLSG